MSKNPEVDQNLDARLGFLEGVMLGFQFVETYEDFREALERATKRYAEIRFNVGNTWDGKTTDSTKSI